MIALVACLCIIRSSVREFRRLAQCTMLFSEMQENHTIHVRDVRISAGAEFVVALTGDIMTMPGTLFSEMFVSLLRHSKVGSYSSTAFIAGLPKTPAAEAVGVAKDGRIYGLF